jgi:hypothetical protein
MSRTLKRLRGLLERRAASIRNTRRKHVDNALKAAHQKILKRQKNALEKKREWKQNHGSSLYRKIWRTSLFARVLDPLAAVGVWSALENTRQGQKVRGTICSYPLKKIDEKLRLYKKQKPLKFKRYSFQIRKAVDRYILFKEKDPLEYAMKVFIPPHWI